MELWIAIIGATISIAIAVIGTIFNYLNNIKIQTRKLKEEHYFDYMKALHNLATNNVDKNLVAQYTFQRDKLFLIASTDVINWILFMKNH